MIRIRLTHALTLALVLLVALALLQGATAYWSAQVATFHVERSALVNQLLSGFSELAADKQRLKVWMAQSLLTGDPDTATRERLFSQMQATLQGLREDTVREQLLLREQEPARARVERLETIAALERNFAELRVRLDAVQKLPPSASAGQVWTEVIRVFDMQEGVDLRRLIFNAIQDEKLDAAAASDAAEKALAKAQFWTAEAAIFALLMAALSAWYLNRRIRSPLADLMNGAESVRRGDLESRIPVRRTDEFGLVAGRFNEMTQELAQRRRQADESQARLEAAIESRTRELERANATLRAVDAQRQEFFADISHELRTPATALRGEAEVTLRGRQLSIEDYRESLKRIVATSVQLGQALDDLLTLARAEGDQLHLKLAPIDPIPPLDEVMKLMEGVAAMAGVTVQVDVADDEEHLPTPRRIVADASRLRQLLMILLDNAICYSRPGQVVKMAVRLDDAGCHYTVQDAGIGIASHDLGRVFDRFYRSAGAREHRADGVGLGLAIAQMIARSHGTEVCLRSESGRGTLARITLETVA